MSVYDGWSIVGDKIYFRGYHVATFREDADRKELPPSVLITAKEDFTRLVTNYR